MHQVSIARLGEQPHMIRSKQFRSIVLNQQRTGHGFYVHHAGEVFAPVGTDSVVPSNAGLIVLLGQVEEPLVKAYGSRGKRYDAS